MLASCCRALAKSSGFLLLCVSEYASSSATPRLVPQFIMTTAAQRISLPLDSASYNPRSMLSPGWVISLKCNTIISCPDLKLRNSSPLPQHRIVTPYMSYEALYIWKLTLHHQLYLPHILCFPSNESLIMCPVFFLLISMQFLLAGVIPSG